MQIYLYSLCNIKLALMSMRPHCHSACVLQKWIKKKGPVSRVWWGPFSDINLLICRPKTSFSGFKKWKAKTKQKTNKKSFCISAPPPVIPLWLLRPTCLCNFFFLGGCRPVRGPCQQLLTLLTPKSAISELVHRSAHVRQWHCQLEIVHTVELISCRKIYSWCNMFVLHFHVIHLFLQHKCFSPLVFNIINNKRFLDRFIRTVDVLFFIAYFVNCFNHQLREEWVGEAG